MVNINKGYCESVVASEFCSHEGQGPEGQLFRNQLSEGLSGQKDIFVSVIKMKGYMIEESVS